MTKKRSKDKIFSSKMHSKSFKEKMIKNPMKKEVLNLTEKV